MNTGIYEINNIITGKKYIGSAANIINRWSTHISQLKSNKHLNKHLQSAWNKYGVEAFEFSVVHQCELDQLIICEQWLIDQYNFDELYNICPKAGSRLGQKFSAETRKRISIARKGMKFSDEHRAKISNSLKGRKRDKPTSNETREKISIAKKGKKFSAEIRKRMNVAKIGKKLSDEHRANISAGLRRKKDL